MAAAESPIDHQFEQVRHEIALRPAYRGAAAVGLLALAAFVLVAILVGSGRSTSIDYAILAALHRLATQPVVAGAQVLTMLGSEAIFVLLPLGTAVLWLRNLKWQAAELVIAALGAQVLNDLLKLGFHRDRPEGFSVASSIPGQAYSFPSGHAMVSIAFFGMLAYVGWRVSQGWPRAVWILFMASLILLVALTRLMLGAHFPTDLVASWAVGLLWVDVTLVGVGYVHQRRSEHRGPIRDAPARAP
jgi:undecaprenyl-diphosphatase